MEGERHYLNYMGTLGEATCGYVTRLGHDEISINDSDVTCKECIRLRKIENKTNDNITMILLFGVIIFGIIPGMILILETN